MPLTEEIYGNNDPNQHSPLTQHNDLSFKFTIKLLKSSDNLWFKEED